MPNPCEVFFRRAGIHHEAIRIGAKEIDDQVIDNAALGIEHAAVQGFAGDLEFGDVVRQQEAQKIAAAGTLQVDYQHVGNIKHARCPADGVMLLDLRAVMQRHIPSAKIDNARAGLDVFCVLRCLEPHSKIPLREPRLSSAGSFACTNKKGGRNHPAAPLSGYLRDQVPMPATYPFGGPCGLSPEPIRNHGPFA